MKTLRDLKEIIAWMDRAEVVALLENQGIACYDSESTDELKEALSANVEDGTITAEEIEESQTS